jgi:hypothetical protein
MALDFYWTKRKRTIESTLGAFRRHWQQLTIIHSTMALFFNNRIFVNVNGHFTTAIDQQRGLRRGDPLSPLLFIVAIETFLLAIQHDQHLPPSTPTLKCLVYADDGCVFLHNSEDLDRLHPYSTLSKANSTITRQMLSL